MSNPPYSSNSLIERVKAEIAELLKIQNYWKAQSLYHEHMEELDKHGYSFERDCEEHLFGPLQVMLDQSLSLGLLDVYENFRSKWMKICPQLFESTDLRHSERIGYLKQMPARMKTAEIRQHLEKGEYSQAAGLYSEYQPILSTMPYSFESEADTYFFQPLISRIEKMSEVDIFELDEIHDRWKEIRPSVSTLAAERKRIVVVIQSIRNKLRAGAYLEARSLYLSSQAVVAPGGYNFAHDAEELLFRHLPARLDEALAEGDLDFYFSLAENCRGQNPALFTIRDEQAKIIGLLKAFSFAAAEERQSRSQALAPDQYASQRRAMVMLWLRTSGLFTLNEEQRASIAAMGAGALLITARAGSGKTRVLVAAAKFISDRLDVNPAHIRLLSFNRKARQEIQTRLTHEFGLPGNDMASTFHALAYRIVRPTDTLLYDRDEDRTLTDLIRQIVDALLSRPDFQRRMYASFREEMVDQEQFGAGLTPSERMVYLRNLSYVSLGGDTVNSKGEKWIADFLFEHDIKYAYERPRIWNGSIYRPDFTIMRGEDDWIILEHWAFDPDDIHATLPEGWELTADEYRQQIYRKRAFWRDKGMTLLETHCGLMRRSREDFETSLKELLENHGLFPKRLPEDEIGRRLCKKQESRISRMFTQLIMRSRKAGWSANEFRSEVAKYKPMEDRERIFLELGTEVLECYEERCRKQGCMDFDKLMELAESKVQQEMGQTPLDRDGQVKVSDLKWILIDEFQDFAPQFNRLVQAIRNHAPQVRIVAVGDDWQAINAFAGSELSFFRQFERHFDSAQRVNLVDNHRSASAIVLAGNRLMQGHGDPAKPVAHGMAHIEVVDVAKEWIEQRKEEEWQEQRMGDAKYVFDHVELEERSKDPDPGKIMARCIKAIHTQLVKHGLLGRTVALLARTAKVHAMDETLILGKLRSVMTPEERQRIGQFQDKFSFGTVHSYKGKEADVVFVLETCRGRFPLLHPDEGFFRIFGRTLQDVLDEERRLFYVAITRAKTHLFLLTEGDRPSDYLFQAFPEEAAMAQIQRGGDPRRPNGPIAPRLPVMAPPVPPPAAIRPVYPAGRVGAIDCDEELYDRLCKVRSRLASPLGLAPTHIFNDRTLRLMARDCPRSPEQLLRIDGVGRHKLNDYGPAFLAEIAAHLDEHPRNPPPQAPQAL